jgi:hypothetical protein
MIASQTPSSQSFWKKHKNFEPNWYIHITNLIFFSKLQTLICFQHNNLIYFGIYM